MPSLRADARVEAWLADQPANLRPLVQGARDLLDDGLPGARQTIKWGYPTWVGASNIASLMAFDGHVNLQFHRGAQLPDRGGLLEGTGVNMRHVKLRHAKDLQVPGVKGLVRAAWRHDQSRPGRGA